MKTKNKRIIAAVLSVIMLSLLPFSGCVPDVDGGSSEWRGECLSGANAPSEFYERNEGDLYVETDDGDIHVYKDGEWVQISNLNNLPFTYNENVNMYCGFDGYLWINGEQTSVVVQDLSALNVMDDTVVLYQSKIYGGNDVSIPAREQIALMGNYGKYAKNTQYSGTTVTEIQVVSKTAGKLDLGTMNLTTREYSRWRTMDVIAGLNTLTCNIDVDEHSTLVIGGSETTVRLYKRSGLDVRGEYGLFTTDVDKDLFPELSVDKTDGVADRLIVSVSAEYAESSLKEHLQTVSTDNEIAVFGGKNVSILGDSISSFNGWSNNTSMNSTMGSQGAHYSEGWNGFTVNDTWWKQLIDKTKTNLVVNNSYAGDTMAGGGQSRCLQLHNNASLYPDIICMFFGINDIWRVDDRYPSPLTLQGFKNAFDGVISKMQQKYPNAIIFVTTYLPYEWWTSSTGNTVIYKKTAQDLEVYNNYVRGKVSTLSGVYLVDLYEDSGITFANYKDYYVNEGNRWLHPNKSGMDKITDCYYGAMYNILKSLADVA